MDSEFEKKIIEDLEKSGFSSELRSIRAFINKNWHCTGFANFFDKDQDIVTGVDLRASKHQEQKHSENLTYGVEFYIDAEVKKSEKPWVLFKERSRLIDDDYHNNLTYINDITPYKLRQAISQNSVYTTNRWRAYGLHESFKKPDAPSRSYSAFIKVGKSAESTLESASAFYREGDIPTLENHKDVRLILVKPIVILDGILLAAELSETGELSVEEINFASVEFHYKSKHCKKGRYLIDVVSIKSLEEYIDLTETRRETIYDEIGLLARRLDLK